MRRTTVSLLFALASACAPPSDGPAMHDGGAPPDEVGAPVVDEPELLALSADGAVVTDVEGHKAERETLALLELGWAAGFGDGTFRPDAAVTRAQLAAMVARAFLSDASAPVAPTFRDVPSTHWAASAIARAAATGFLRGYPDGTFRPEQTLTRLELAVALANGLGLFGGAWSDVERAYVDAGEVPTWARGAIANAEREGMFANLSLHGGWLRSSQPASRAVVASYLYHAQTVVLACDDARMECRLGDPRTKAAPLVIGGVVLTWQAAVAIWASAVTLGYLATRPDQPSFGEVLADLRRLTPGQLARARANAGTASRTCSEARFRELRQAKSRACRQAGCTSGAECRALSCGDLRERHAQGEECLRVRALITAECYRGIPDDFNHPEEEANERNRLAGCARCWSAHRPPCTGSL